MQLGVQVTKGLGAGSHPDIGKSSADETKHEIMERLEGTNMLFITAGMGGGTGTGAAPVIARVARELGILTVAVVTKPFQFEGAGRMRIAEQGPLLSNSHSSSTFELKWFSNNCYSKYTQFSSNTRYHWSSACTSTATHTSGNEKHVCAFKSFHYFVFSFIG